MRLMGYARSTIIATCLDAPQLCSLGTRRSQRGLPPGVRRTAVPMRAGIPDRRRLDDACSPYTVVFSAPSHVRPARRPRRGSRVRLRPLRSPAGLPRARGSVRTPGAIREEGPPRLRTLRASRPRRCHTQRVRRVRLRLRSQLPEAVERRAQDPASARLLLLRAPDRIRDDEGWLCGVRVPGLRAPVLFRRSSGARQAGGFAGEGRWSGLIVQGISWRCGACQFRITRAVADISAPGMRFTRMKRPSGVTS